MTPKKENTMTPSKLLVAASLAMLAAACGGSVATDEFALATPDVAGLTLETDGGPADGIPAPGAPLSSVAAGCQPYQYLCNVQAAVAGLNGFVRMAVAPVEALAATTPVEVSRHVRLYGPARLPAGDAAMGLFKLTVFRAGGDGNGLYRWKLEAAPLAADPADATAYRIVMAGGLKRSERAHRGHGTIGIDVDAAAAVLGADRVGGQGKLLASFAHVGGHKALAYVVKDFRADAGSELVPLGVLVGHKNEGGPARVRIASLKDWVSPAAPAAAAGGDELLVSRAAWLPGVGGRAAVAVGGGDVPGYSTAEVPVDYFLGVSCYDRERNEVYRDLFACVRPTSMQGGMNQGGRSCVPVPGAWLPDPGYRTGDASLCRLPGDEPCDDGHPPPETDLSTQAPEPGAPATPDAPPLAMPDAAF
jgi:hypothetical protein